MTKFNFRHLLAICLTGVLLASCKKEGCTDNNAINYEPKAKKDDNSCVYHQGELNLAFNHTWAMSSAPFETGKDFVHPKTKDTLNYVTFSYYVSNIQLKDIDGNWWKEEESYYLVDLNNVSSQMLKIKSIPDGAYTAIRYTLGVDSLRNVSGAQTGALSTTNGMFWSWNTGYIMVKAEGLSPNSSTGSFTFHLGGFSGGNNIVTTIQNDFGDIIYFDKVKSPSASINVNPARMFHSAPSVSERSSVHMPGEIAHMMGTDFYGSFSLISINQ